MRVRSWNKAGMTLIELLFSMLIMGIVTAGIFKLFTAYHSSYGLQQSIADVQQNGRIGLATLNRELRWAGFGLLDVQSPGPVDSRSCHAWTSALLYEVEGDQSIRFLSNLHGVRTRLDTQALPGDTGLFIPNNRTIQNEGLDISRGSAFQRNDTIYLYNVSSSWEEGGPNLKATDVECHKLTTAGISGQIRLAPGDSIRKPFPVGSPIHVVNELNYYLDRDTRRLMRRIDGGTAVLADGIHNLIFIGMGNRVIARLVLEGMARAFNQHGLALKTSVTLRNQ
jgi:prepilin-type N-terminal cleavage/methylation domain-containing protein